VPYSSDCYAAIGTALVRTVVGLNSHPFKVIVLDCDNTLWQGVCAEDGPLGIDVTPHHRALQDFMLRQMNAGMLLCLCSKNNEQDVLDVFDRRSDMILRREHMVSWRINWNSKAANITSLATELNLGLDSFILVDDNPVEVADVRSRCPDVLALQLPPDPASFPAFLDHVWAFDRRSATDEDRNRTRLYRENTERLRLRESSLSLQDFISGLDLRVEISEAADDHVARVSQLTLRTNQFNLTTIRRTEDEIRHFMQRDEAECLVVRVVDRFGDYGLVGVVMYEAAGDRCTVDTFLLSCRVLGRGVEHAVVSHLARRAQQEGRRWIELACQPTSRNTPARDFLAGLGGHRTAPGLWLFRVEDLVDLRFAPEGDTPGTPMPAATIDAAPRRRQPSMLAEADRTERLQRIGEQWSDIRRLSTAIELYRFRQQPISVAEDAAPSDGSSDATLETALATIWSKVLARPRVGLHDNFFEVGGTSLRAVQVIASIRRELKQAVSIVSLFEAPTVALLAGILRAKSDGSAHGGTLAADAARRGQQRRYASINRRQ
jgi:FkbH-like protein